MSKYFGLEYSKTTFRASNLLINRFSISLFICFFLFWEKIHFFFAGMIFFVSIFCLTLQERCLFTFILFLLIKIHWLGLLSRLEEIYWHISMILLNCKGIFKVQKDIQLRNGVSSSILRRYFFAVFLVALLLIVKIIIDVIIKNHSS